MIKQIIKKIKNLKIKIIKNLKKHFDKKSSGKRPVLNIYTHHLSNYEKKCLKNKKISLPDIKQQIKKKYNSIVCRLKSVIAGEFIEPLPCQIKIIIQLHYMQYLNWSRKPKEDPGVGPCPA